MYNANITDTQTPYGKLIEDLNSGFSLLNKGKLEKAKDIGQEVNRAVDSMFIPENSEDAFREFQGFLSLYEIYMHKVNLPLNEKFYS